jgi:hypothetical protein
MIAQLMACKGVDPIGRALFSVRCGLRTSITLQRHVFTRAARDVSDAKPSAASRSEIHTSIAT